MDMDRDTIIVNCYNQIRKNYKAYYENRNIFKYRKEIKTMDENIMNNEELIETTEEIVSTNSNSNLKTATTIGLAMIAGGLAYKFIVKPAFSKFKNWREESKNDDEDIIDGDAVEIDDETEEAEG